MKALVVSDIHFHPWSLFSSTNTSGMNSRLQIVLDELRRGAAELRAQGGRTMIVAGDIFHTRGAIDPEVLNPVRDVFGEILQGDIDIYIIPGNHDLKSDDTNRLSSAVQNLEQIDISGGKIVVMNEADLFEIDRGTFFGFAPWRHTTEALLQDLEALSKRPEAGGAHVFIHAGIDGVLSGVPGHGLTAGQLSAFGFKGVYAGHYHNHADMSTGLPNRVMSIGATTHHNWGDIGTRAGFLILDTDANTVQFHDTNAPKFVDVSGLPEFDMAMNCPGNYVRFRGPQMTQEEINELREALKGWGALGVSIEVPRATVAVRASAPASGRTLEQSIDAFVTDMKDVPAHVKKEEVVRRSVERLNAARAVTAEA